MHSDHGKKQNSDFQLLAFPIGLERTQFPRCHELQSGETEPRSGNWTDSGIRGSSQGFSKMGWWWWLSQSYIGYVGGLRWQWGLKTNFKKKLKGIFVQEGSSGTRFDHVQLEIKTFPIYAPP